MDKNFTLTKVLAVAGTALAWFPFLATILFSALGSIRDRVFRLDYLIPAELFLVAFTGGGLLLWAALRARSQRRLIAWGLGGMVALLVGSQALAEITGLASGETEAVGWPWALVIALFIGYSLALVEIGVAGILLSRDIFWHAPKGING